MLHPMPLSLRHNTFRRNGGNMDNSNSFIINDSKSFGLRLARLREGKSVSAREMSLSIGQNKNYINAIETGKNYPSMSSFLYICEYMEITPKDFFDTGCKNPFLSEEFIKIIQQLNPEQIEHLYQIVLDIASKA